MGRCGICGGVVGTGLVWAWNEVVRRPPAARSNVNLENLENGREIRIKSIREGYHPALLGGFVDSGRRPWYI
jgi:hypothetical protein